MTKLSLYGVASLTAVGLFLLAGTRSAETALPQHDNPFPEAEVVTDGQLAQLRGGFSVPTLPGVSFNFGVSITTTFDAPDLPDSPTLSIETSLYFEDNGDSPEVPTHGTVTSKTTSSTTGGTEVLNEVEHENVDFSEFSFGTTNTVKVADGTLTIQSNSGFGDLNEVPDASLEGESPNLVLVNSFSNDLIASVISNTLSGVAINQTTTVDIDLAGHEEFSKTLPSVGVRHMLHSIDNSVLMGLTN